MKILKLSTSFALVAIVNCGFAQRMELNEGSIAVNYTLLPTQAFKDTTGNLQSHAIGGSISIPLFGNRSNKSSKQQGSGFYQTSLHTSFESSEQTIGFIKNETQRTFYNGAVGINGFFFNGKKDFFLVDAAMGIASDRASTQSNDLRYRFSGSFIVNHIQNPTLTYQYGIVLTYAYGRPLPLPVLGIRKKLSDTWTLSAVLPVSVQVSGRLNKKMRLSLSLRPEGNRFQFQNQNDFTSTESVLYMQLRQFQLGASYTYRFAKSFSVGAEAGLLFGGKLKFTDPQNTKTILYQTGVNAGSRLRFSLRYHLPNKKTKDRNMDMDGEMFRMN